MASRATYAIMAVVYCISNFPEQDILNTARIMNNGCTCRKQVSIVEGMNAYDISLMSRSIVILLLQCFFMVERYCNCMIDHAMQDTQGYRIRQNF